MDVELPDFKAIPRCIRIGVTGHRKLDDQAALQAAFAAHTTRTKVRFISFEAAASTTNPQEFESCGYLLC
jgi:hypothetical protein